MSERLRELREAQQKAVADAQAALDAIADADEARAKELEEQADKAFAEYDNLETKAAREEEHVKRQKLLSERQRELDEIDRSRRPVSEERTARGEGREEVTPEQYAAKRRSAFVDWVRYGPEGINAEQRNLIAEGNREARAMLGEAEARAQGVATVGAGGALVPEDYMAEIIMSLKDYGPMNDGSVVRVIQTGNGADLPWPTVDDTSNKGALIGENTAASEQDVTFSSKTLEAFKYTTKLVKVSRELLQDSVFNVEEELRMLLSERIGRILNEHFTTGTGSSQPNGIVTAATEGVEAASATTLTANELIDLEHSVDPAYRRDPSCRFMFNDTTFKVIRKLTDGQGNYLWQPADLRTTAPASFLGFPYSINQDMDSFGDSSPATDNRPVVFGAFNRYVVRMVRALTIRRLDERYAEADQVAFIGFMRADGELMDTAAIKYLRAAE